jgi:hypothetical protein
LSTGQTLKGSQPTDAGDAANVRTIKPVAKS